MKDFEFIALDSSGRKKPGVVRARSLSDAKKKVQGGGFYIISIEIKDGSGCAGKGSFSFFKEIKELFFSKEKINVRG